MILGMVLVLSASVTAAPAIAPIGSPPQVSDAPHPTYRFNAESGLQLEVTGPTAVLLQVWSQTAPDARVNLTVTRDKRYVSKNTVRFRRVSVGGPPGRLYATLLSVVVPAGKHHYRITSSVDDLAIAPTLTKKPIRAFAAASEYDVEGAPNVEEPLANASDTKPVVQIEVVPGSPPDSSVGAGVVSPGGAGDAGQTSSITDTLRDGGANGSDAQPAGGAAPAAATEAAAPAPAPEILTVGGTMFVRARVAWAEAPNGSSVTTLNSPNSFFGYMDATPNESVRAYVRARVRYDPTTSVDGQTAQVSLNQFWIKVNIAQIAYFTFGQQLLWWGTGRVHNPTDFMNRTQRDPFTLLDERPGVPMAMLHVPLPQLGLNLYTIASLASVSTFHRVAGTFRAELALGLLETALTAQVGEKQRGRYGASWKLKLPFVEVYGEGDAQQAGTRRFLRGDLDIAAGVVPEVYMRDRDEWLFRLVGGLQTVIKYDSEHKVILGGEVFINDRGYSSAELYPWMILRGTFTPYFNGRHYLDVYSIFPWVGPFKNTAVLAGTNFNLDDGSRFTWMALRHVVKSSLTVLVNPNLQWGRNGEFHFSTNQPANPAVGVEAPLVINKPSFSVIVGLLLNM